MINQYPTLKSNSGAQPLTNIIDTPFNRHTAEGQLQGLLVFKKVWKSKEIYYLKDNRERLSIIQSFLKVLILGSQIFFLNIAQKKLQKWSKDVKIRYNIDFGNQTPIFCCIIPKIGAWACMYLCNNNGIFFYESHCCW